MILGAILVFTTLFVSACGGGGGSDSTPVTNITVDTTTPVLSDIGRTFSSFVGDSVTTRSLTAIDDIDGSVPVTKTGTVDSNTIGSYSVVHSAKDSSNNSSSATDTYNILKVPNNAPTVTDDNISIVLLEYATSTTDLLTNVSDTDGDNLTVVSVIQLDGNTTLPTGYSLTDGNLTINATTINVADGVNLNYDLNITITDGDANVSYIVNSTIQDGLNDKPLTYTIDLPSTLDANETLTGSITLSDDDGLSNTNITIELQDVDNSNNVVYTGEMVDSKNNGAYEISIDLTANSIPNGNYALVAIVSPVIGGDNPQGDVTISHSIKVGRNTAPTWTASSYDTGVTVYDDLNTNQIVLDLTTISSDTDGDNVNYSIISVSKVPNISDQDEWNNSININNNNVLVVSNLMNENPFVSGNVSVIIRVSDDLLINDTNVSFYFQNVN